MKQICIILGIIIFTLVTFYILESNDTKNIKRVYIQSQTMALNQQGTGITKQEINFQNNNYKIEQTETYTTKNYEQKTTNYQSDNYLDKEIMRFDSENSYDNSNRNRLKNIESGIVRKKQQDYPRYSEPTAQQDNPRYDKPTAQPAEHGFVNLDISWNTWKSNFINQILDDSMDIKTLNSYNVGTWFYYSFEVTDTGEIQNVKVSSLFLSKEDKEEVIRLIKSYAHKQITAFPRNSKRKKAKVDAIMLLGETESKTSPNDFNDTERVRIHY